MPSYIFQPKDAILPTTNPAAYSDPDGTNFSYGQLAFDATTQEQVFFIAPMDSFYNSATLYFDIWWKAAATSGDVVWQINLLGRVDGEVWDAAMGTDEYVVDTAKGTTEYLAKATVEVSTTGLVPSDLIVIKLSRDADSTNDTDDMAGDAKFLSMRMRFNVAG